MKLFKKKADDVDYRAMQQLASDLHNLSAAISVIMRRNGCEAPEIGEPLPDAMRKVLDCLITMEAKIAAGTGGAVYVPAELMEGKRDA